MNQKIAAVEITDDAVRIAVIKSGGKQPTVLETIEVPVDRHAADSAQAKAAAARAAAARVSSSPTAYVLVAPISWAVVRRITVPFKGRRKIAAAAPFELEPHLALPIDDLALDFLPIDDKSKENSVLAIGLRRDRINETVDFLEEAGIPVDGVLLDALALSDLWQSLRVETGGVHAVLHLRDRGSSFAVLDGKSLVGLRRVDTNADAMRSNPAACAREVTNLIRAIAAESKAQRSIESLTVTGATLSESVRTVFESELDLPVAYHDLASALPGVEEIYSSSEGPAEGANENNRWSSLAAAANSAAGSPHVLNFMKTRFSSSETRKALSAYAMRACVLAAVAFSALLGLFYADYRKTITDIDRLGEAIWGEFAATYPDVAPARPVEDLGGVRGFDLMLTAAEAEREITTAFAPEIFSRPTLLEVLDEISHHVPGGVASISQIDVSVSKSMTVTISGEVRNGPRFAEAIERLRTSRVFTIKPGSLRRVSVEGKETFTLEATR